MENLAALNAKEVESSSKEKKKGVFPYRRTVRVKVKRKTVSTSFPKIEGRGTFVGAEERRKKDGW